jgi:hypothetical protein
MRRANEDDETILENARKVTKLRICGGGRDNAIVAVKEMEASEYNGCTDVCLELERVLVPLLRVFRARRPHCQLLTWQCGRQDWNYSRPDSSTATSSV